MALLSYRRYALPFRQVVRTAHGEWLVREGFLIRVESESGAVGFGEVAPIPGFTEETVQEDAAALSALGGELPEGILDRLPKQLGCLAHGLREATTLTGTRPGDDQVVPLAALLPAGRDAIRVLGEKAALDFRTFKWKVGVQSVDDELVLLDDLCAELPQGGRLRLDANGAWNRKQAERWLERCADRPVEYVEQPCYALRASQGTALLRPSASGAALLRPGTSASTLNPPSASGADLLRAGTSGSDRAREMDLLKGLAADFPTPIALDESIAGDDDLERWIGSGWPGVFVVKPALHGDVARALESLAPCADRVVFSSAFETALGARDSLRAAFGFCRANRLPVPRRAMGFGVWPLFEDQRFNAPFVGSFLRESDVEFINPEALWNALS